MVVIASMIGAPGLGREVLSSLQRAQVGTGFVAGLGIVILAIIIDRLTQNINKKKTKFGIFSLGKVHINRFKRKRGDLIYV